MVLIRIRSALGIVLGTLAGILFLKYADTQNPFAEPSHLYQENNGQLGAGLPWWLLAGAVMGLVIALSLWRYERQLQLGFINITVTIALVAFILTYIAFSGYAITLTTYLLVSVINFILLTILASLPAAASLVIISMISSRPAKRSGWDIMPEELRAERQRKLAQKKRSPLLDWLTRNGPPTSR